MTDYAELWQPYCGAVSITFDDGLACQLQKAIPLMDDAGVRGTFFLGPRGDDWERRLAPWAEMARAGHELGNHSMSHTCSANFGGGRGGLESKALEEIEADILAAQERLVQVAPDQDDWTFGYPCYQSYVGRGASRQSYVPLIARNFLAGRGGGEYGFANSPDAVDLACVWSLSVERMSGFEMVGLVEELTAQGRWVVLTLHEIDGARLTVGSHEFRTLMGYLRRRSDVIWTAPFGEVARKIAEFQAAAS